MLQNLFSCVAFLRQMENRLLVFCEHPKHIGRQLSKHGHQRKKRRRWYHAGGSRYGNGLRKKAVNSTFSTFSTSEKHENTIHFFNFFNFFQTMGPPPFPLPPSPQHFQFFCTMPNWRMNNWCWKVLVEGRGEGGRGEAPWFEKS